MPIPTLLFSPNLPSSFNFSYFAPSSSFSFPFSLLLKTVNTGALYPTEVCVPISFNSSGPDDSLTIPPEILYVSPVIPDGTLAKGSLTKDVYLIKDGKMISFS